MTINIREYAVSIGISREVLDEIVDKAVILVEGETIDKDIITIDNYYFWEEEKTVGDYIFDLVSMSHDKKARKIYALLIGEKHVLSLEIVDGKIKLLDIGEKVRTRRN